MATVGTVNMDYRSFELHFECGAWMCNNDTVLDIKDHFASIFSQSHEIKLDEWRKRPLSSRLKQSVLHVFAPFM